MPKVLILRHVAGNAWPDKILYVPWVLALNAAALPPVVTVHANGAESVGDVLAKEVLSFPYVQASAGSRQGSK